MSTFHLVFFWIIDDMVLESLYNEKTRLSKDSAPVYDPDESLSMKFL